MIVREDASLSLKAIRGLTSGTDRYVKISKRTKKTDFYF